MNPRQFLRALKHLAGDIVPWQLVATVRGRDYDAAVLAAADQLADVEAEYETLEQGTSLRRGLKSFERGERVSSDWLFAPEPPVEVEPHPPVAPSAGLNPIDLEFAAGVIKAYAALGDMYDAERADLRALAARLAPPK